MATLPRPAFPAYLPPATCRTTSTARPSPARAAAAWRRWTRRNTSIAVTSFEDKPDVAATGNDRLRNADAHDQACAQAGSHDCRYGAVPCRAGRCHAIAAAGPGRPRAAATPSAAVPEIERRRSGAAREPG